MGGYLQIRGGELLIFYVRCGGVGRGKGVGTDLDELKCGRQAGHMHTCMPSMCHQGYGWLAANA
jgi:hypothetical protein